MIARRAQEIEPFLAVEVFQRAQAMEREGIDVVHLMFGEPDFETPPVIREAAEKALKDGRTRYAHTLGILPLREAIAEHYHARYGVTVSPDQILVTAGTSPAMLLLFTTLLDRGDQVILSDPHYACYPKFVKYAEAEPLYVPVEEDDAFQFRPEEVRARLTPRTKAIVINSPANPTGTVLGPDRMAALAECGPWIVSDEIYHGLTYEGPEHSILEFTDRAFVLNGFSKAFAMTGWRIGYLIAPREFMPTLQATHGNFFISTNEFVQWAALAALREAGPDAARFRRIFDERRRAMVAGLVRIGLGVGAPPTGAFYVLANARRYTGDSLRSPSICSTARTWGSRPAWTSVGTRKAICASPMPPRSSGSRKASTVSVASSPGCAPSGPQADDGERVDSGARRNRPCRRIADEGRVLDAKATRARKILGRLDRAYPDAAIALRFSNPLELLVATILSAQCTDERVNAVTETLFKRYRSAKDYADSDPATLERDIHATGFFQAKTRVADRDGPGPGRAACRRRPTDAGGIDRAPWGGPEDRECRAGQRVRRSRPRRRYPRLPRFAAPRPGASGRSGQGA